jgi:DNA-nicking Smr family endonuclease
VRKKRKKGETGADSSEPKVAAPPKIGTSLQGAISGWKQKEAATAAERPKPAARGPVHTLPPPGPASLVPVSAPPLPPPLDRKLARKLSTEDQNALERAFSGVRPLTERKRGGPSATVVQASQSARRNDAEARARLDALVGRAAHVVVERNDEHVSGLRDGVAKTVLRRLRSEQERPEATLDLHGERAQDVGGLVSRFVRMQHKKGLRLLLIIHGKGQHSEHGIGVLIDPLVATLSEGGAAPLVAAFTSAHVAHGGSGAIMVELIDA